MRKPDSDALAMAAAWLDEYDGGGEKAERQCEAVAAWLRHEIREGQIHAAARRNKVPIAIAREAFARLEQRGGEDG